MNTNTNVETCGLLLGNEVWVDDGGDEHGQVSYHGNGKHHEKESTGGRKKTRCDYVVTTLLIPKQRGTSDTCTMDGEELVLEFVDQRSLITLGWVGSFFWSESENIYLCMTLDSYASFAILFYVFGGSSYPFRVSEDVA